MHLGLGSISNKDTPQHDPKELRRVFKESVRTDWDYPSLPAYQQESRPLVVAGGFRIHNGTPRELTDQLVPEVEDWKERYYGSSDSEVDDEAGGSTMPYGHIAIPKCGPGSSKFIFDTPDSVGEQVANHTLARKRKRQHMLAEEIAWNDGLDHYLRRRDVWTGARTVPQVQLMRANKTAVSSVAEAYNNNGSISSSPRSSTSINTDVTTLSTRPSTATTSPDPAAMYAKAPLGDAVLPDMLVPAMSRLMTSHPVRKKIGPGMYVEIYSKIVLQSRTPAVPINLLHLTHALVQGWKSDGEWPPRPSVPEPSFSRKKAIGIKQGVRAVTRVLKITSSDSAAKKHPS